MEVPWTCRGCAVAALRSRVAPARHWGRGGAVEGPWTILAQTYRGDTVEGVVSYVIPAMGHKG